MLNLGTATNVSRLWWCAVAAATLMACGGSVSTVGNSAGAPGTGGGGSSGASSAGAAGCVVDGRTYADGVSFPGKDGCNDCSCNAGTVSCTLKVCVQGCVHGGKTYLPGQTFDDECNTCTCGADGTVLCTLGECPVQCSDVQTQYAEALKRAKACDPKLSINQCTSTVSGAIGCGCPTPVNSANAKALDDLGRITDSAAPACLTLCTPCVEFPGVPICGVMGSCEVASTGPGAASCKVAGVVYAHGTSGIKNPFLCDAPCSCDDGKLVACAKKVCPSEAGCPNGSTPGTQCVQCGPTDACQVVETLCLQSCSDNAPCMTGVCSDGYCRKLGCG